MLDSVIHGFEEHLRHHRLVRTRLVSFFGNWPRRFLLFPVVRASVNSSHV